MLKWKNHSLSTSFTSSSSLFSLLWWEFSQNNFYVLKQNQQKPRRVPPLPLSVLCWWCDCIAFPTSCWISSSPWSIFCQKLPRHPLHHTNPAAQRVLGETKRLHQANQKNHGNETLWSALWETQCQKPAQALMKVWRWGWDKARQEAPRGGWLAPCPQLTSLCFVRPQQLREQNLQHQP